MPILQYLKNRLGSSSSLDDPTEYEEDVQDRCDHTFEESVEDIPYLAWDEAEVDGDHLVVPQYEKVEEYCRDCGSHRKEDRDFAGYRYKHGVSYVRVARRYAIPVAYVLDPDVTLSEALAEPVSDEGGGGGGDNAIYVNRAENPKS